MSTTEGMIQIQKPELIYLGGGCFWCVDAVFRQLQGVLRVRCGYMGGQIAHPTYQQVCSGTTGHAEVVEVLFDARELPLHSVLEVFFSAHDPTTLNRQGSDVGTQYRSVIFYTTLEQKQAVEKFVRDLEANKVFMRPIVTEISKAARFYEAEDYHQNYFNMNTHTAYCQYVILPKLKQIKKLFPELLRAPSPDHEPENRCHLP